MRIKSDYYKIAVENAPIHIILTDPNGKILYANPGVEKITEYKQKEIIGKTPRLWGKQMGAEFYGELWDTIKNKKQIFSGELINRRKNGQKYDAHIIIKPILEKDKVVGYAGIEQDITPLRKAHKDLKKTNKKLLMSNNMKDMFMDIMRHDILNPLTVIKTHAQILKQSITNKKVVSNLCRSVNNAIEIIECAKKYAKLENTKTFPKEEIILNEIISDMVGQVRPRYKSAGMKMINNVKQKYKIMGNPVISEVFLNLLTNALKYAPEGNKVIIDAQKKGKNVVIKVTDFGEGVPDKYKKKIFNRLTRLEKDGVKGTGLGLSIVDEIVKLHKGKVWVEDNPKGGCVFAVSLPVVKDTQR